MAAVWMRFRAELRSRWRSWLALSLLVGLFGGAVLAAAAGARRTDSVVDRFVEKKDPPNIFFVQFFSASGLPNEITEKLAFDRLLELDSVEAGERLHLMPVQGDIEVAASDDPRLGTATFPVNVIEGRLPDPRRIDEAFINVVASERFGLHPGDTYTVGFFGAGAFLNDDSPPPPGPEITFRITGVGSTLGDFAAIAGPSLTLTPAFLDGYREAIGPIELSMLRLKEGTASYDEFAAEIGEITQGQTIFYDESGRWDEARDSFGLQATALWIFAGLLGTLTLLVVGQAIARQTFLDSTDNGSMRALGISRGQLATIALLRSTWIGMVGGVVAVVIAAAASPLTPFGSARLADPDPSFSFPAIPMSLGFIGILSVVIALAMYPAIRIAQRGWDPDASGAMVRPHRLVEAIGRIARKPAPAIGARMAFERGRGRTAVPVRTTIAGTAVCLLALAAALVVGSSLDRLSDDPSLYGWNWDAAFSSSIFNDDPKNTVDGPVAQQVLRDMDGIAAVTFGPDGGSINVNGIPVEPYGLPLGAVVAPPILEGRAPAAPDEIAIGRQTMRDADARIGDIVRIGFQGSPREAPFRVVGVTVLPVAGEASHLGEGIWIPIEELETLFGDPIPVDRALVRYEPGLDPTQLERFIRERFEAQVRIPESPGTVLDFGRVSAMPTALAGIVAVLAAGTLGHGLLTAIRRRRRDLSILKSIGFDGKQIRSAVGWQATATALPTLAIGLSLGVLVGRLMWNAMARNTGFVARPVVDLWILGIVAAGALIAVNLIAVVPARAAARTQPAVVLRTE